MLRSFSEAHLNCWGLKCFCTNCIIQIYPVCSAVPRRQTRKWVHYTFKGGMLQKKKHANLVALLLCVVSVEVFGSGLAEEEEDQEGEGEGEGEEEDQEGEGGG